MNTPAAATTGYAVSVVIPTKNDAAGLRRCLESLFRQSVLPRQVIVIDSGSIDGTVEVARSFAGVQLVEIDPATFSHGGTRNLGARLAIGEFVLFTVQDAYAADDRWIERLLEGFVADDIAGVCGAQVVPHDAGANPVEWFRPRSMPQVEVFRFGEAEAFDRLSPAEKKRACGWDDVTAMYRREALCRIGFRPVVFGEDVWFAVDAYRAGYALAYNPAARAYHYHLEDGPILLKRTLLSTFTRYHALGWVPEPPALVDNLLKAARVLLREREVGPARKLAWLRYNLVQLLAIRAAVRAFSQALAKGPGVLNALERAYCDTPSIPLQVAA